MESDAGARTDIKVAGGGDGTRRAPRLRRGVFQQRLQNQQAAADRSQHEDGEPPIERSAERRRLRALRRRSCAAAVAVGLFRVELLPIN